MRRITALLLILSMSACMLAGCASGGQDKGTSGNENRETTRAAAVTETASEASANTESTTAPAPDQNADTPAEGSHIVTDSIGRQVELPSPVSTAVVANANNVEIINAIDCLDRVIGVDYNIFQDKESWKNQFTEDQVIGKSQKELNYEKIIELNPQVLILTGNGTWEEAEQQLEPFGIKVCVVDAYYTDQFEQTCQIMGEIFGENEKAKELSDYFMDKLDYINTQLAGVEKKTVYFEYRREGNTTIPGNFFYYMIEYSGADNVFKDSENVEVDTEAVVVKNPACIVKVSAPDVYSSYYPPTTEEHQAIKEELVSRPGWDEITAVKDDNILLLSHYVHGGASKLVGTMYVAKFLYPDLLPDLHPEQVFKDWLEKYQKLEYIEGHTYPAFGLDD